MNKDERNWIKAASSDEIRDWLGWREGVTVEDLATCLIEAFERIRVLESWIAELRDRTGDNR